MVDDVQCDQAIAHADDVLMSAAGGDHRHERRQGPHPRRTSGIDFEGAETVMSEPGLGVMGTASAGGTGHAKAAEAAVAWPLLEGIDHSGARGPGRDGGKQADLELAESPSSQGRRGPPSAAVPPTART